MKKLVVAFVFVLFFSGMSAAAEWDFYGSARVSTFYTDFEKDPFGTSPGASTPGALGLEAGPDTENYEQNLNGNARIGAKVKVSDSLTGQFEYGALGSNANVRVLWGEWNFGAGSLGVGKNYTPLLFPYSNQVYNVSGFNKGDTNMSYFGMLYGDRKPMIQLKMGGFKIALVKPNTLVYVTPTYYSNYNLYAPATNQPSTTVKLPSIQAKYKSDFNWGHIGVAAGYQTFDVEKNGKSYEVESYIIGVGGQLNIGPAYFKGNIWGGQNVGQMVNILVNTNLYSTTNSITNSKTDLDGDGFGLARWDGTKVTDKDSICGLAVAGLEIRKGLYLEAGCGYVSTKLDEDDASTDDCLTIYLQSTIFLAPGVFLTPEIGQCDFKQDGQSVLTYAGIKWQINF